MGNGNSKQLQAQVPSATYKAFRLPLSFNLYQDRSWGKIRLHLGEDRSHPIYLFSMPGGWYGDLFIHSGPTADAPPLASACNSGKVGSHTAITLPALEPGMPPIQGEFEMGSWRKDVYSFEVPIGTGLKRSIERFEWRRSSRDEVRALGEQGHGWKLLRPSGGDEILAVWADASLSMSKAARFQFMNAEATSALGEAWALMAVLTFVRLWQKMMQRKIAVAVNA
jgi:hypothetical protein